MGKPKVGDIIEIPLSGGRKAYAHYLSSSEMGPIIRVLDVISRGSVELKALAGAGQLFPPVIVGLFAAVRARMWKVIGSLPIPQSPHPQFVSTLYDQKTGRARTWFLWDGERDHELGETLRPEHKDLEFLVVWNPMDVVKRIETGEIPFPYGELIRDNRFQPR